MFILFSIFLEICSLSPLLPLLLLPLIITFSHFPALYMVFRLVLFCFILFQYIYVCRLFMLCIFVLSLRSTVYSVAVALFNTHLFKSHFLFRNDHFVIYGVHEIKSLGLNAINLLLVVCIKEFSRKSNLFFSFSFALLLFSCVCNYHKTNCMFILYSDSTVDNKHNDYFIITIIQINAALDDNEDDDESIFKTYFSYSFIFYGFSM